MWPKIFKFITSSIEENIVTSFSDIAINRNVIIEKSIFSQFISRYRIAIKRGIDLFSAVVLLLVSLPLVFVIAAAIKIDSRGPVLFLQNRVGLKGKKFKIRKFRTMHPKKSDQEHREYVKYLLQNGDNAENRADLLAQYISHVDGNVTRVGRFLRATSLDELPQLINILLGDMSLVGPRPHPLYEVEEYKEWYRRRLEIKPGLTGWSKLNLRNTPLNYEESILYDLWYVDHWNLSLDIKILLMTIPFVLLMNDVH